MARSTDFQQGTRVECLDKRGGRRLAMLTGHQETRAHGLVYLELIHEGCATGRPEFWLKDDIRPLPKQQQMVALGGCFRPPKGYPFITKAKP